MKGHILTILLGFLGAFLFQIIKPLVIPPSLATPTSHVLKLSGINLVDAKGRIRIQLGFSKEGPPGIWLLDEKGTARLIMGLYEDQTSYLGLQDKNGLMIELMRSVGPKETPLLIFKHQGQDKMITGLDSSAKSFLQYEEMGKTRMLFGTYEK